MSYPSGSRRESPRRFLSPIRSAVAVLIATAIVNPGLVPVGATTVDATAAQAAVPVNQAPTSAVALAAHPSGFDYVFYRGLDDAVYYRTYRNGAWSAETGLGG